MYELRDYQKQIIEDESQFKAIRKGRRVGATLMLAAALEQQATNVPFSRSVCISSMEWVTTLVAEYVMEMAGTPKNVDVIYAKGGSKVSALKFGNGSVIDFTTSSASLRGRSYDLYVVDEADYGGIPLREIYLLALESGAKVIFAGTPTPSTLAQSMFRTLAESDNFTQWHLPCSVNPNWSKETEDEMRQVFSEDAFNMEVKAEWPEPRDITIREAY